MNKAQPLTEALFYILLSLNRPNHGYGVIQQVAALTNSRVVLGPGTLYGAISALLEKGWISLYSQEAEARKKKEYLITPAGTLALKEETARLREMITNAQAYMKENGSDERA